MASRTRRHCCYGLHRSRRRRRSFPRCARGPEGRRDRPRSAPWRAALAAEHPEKVATSCWSRRPTAVGSGPGSPRWDKVMGLDGADRSRRPVHEGLVRHPNPVDEDFLARERTEERGRADRCLARACCGAPRPATCRAPSPVPSKSPVMVLWGEKDKFFDLPHQEKLEKAYPEAGIPSVRQCRSQHVLGISRKERQLIDDFSAPSPRRDIQ